MVFWHSICPTALYPYSLHIHFLIRITPPAYFKSQKLKEMERNCKKNDWIDVSIFISQEFEIQDNVLKICKKMCFYVVFGGKWIQKDCIAEKSIQIYKPQKLRL